MSRTVSASACGKVILTGEHAVVYGEPALALPLSSARLTVTLEEGEGVGLADEAPEGAVDSVIAALGAVVRSLGVETPRARLQVDTGLLRSGMGTSAALGVALARALLLWNERDVEQEAVLAAAAEVERHFHGTPSGIDHTVSALEAPVWFVRGRAPEVLDGLRSLPLLVLPRASRCSTAETVADVRAKLEREPALVKVLVSMGRASWEARQAWEHDDMQWLAAALGAQQRGLDRLGVVDAADREGIRTAVKAGARAAKVTGAGRGGTLLALVDEESRAAVREAWGEGVLG